ncbi:MAG: hypothetical protein AAB267_05175 [Candidatus Desantisbacteria bacterium]
MAYRKAYPSKLEFDLRDTTLYVHSSGSSGKTHDNPPDLWGIKYLFDKGISNTLVKICVDGTISETMALRMYFLKHLFPNIEFHDADGDRYIAVAEEIRRNVGTKYITYSRDHPLDNRGTKKTLESRIEKELADKLPKYISDFPDGAKVIRQFPANVFENTISEESRITDKLWIDMVSVNMTQELSPIELKVGRYIPLDLFAQGLNYGIYCHLFNQYIKQNWFSSYCSTMQDKVTIYYVGEEFHPALTGRDGEKGIVSLIRKNELFNIVFVRISVDKNSQSITGSEFIFDIRKQ